MSVPEEFAAWAAAKGVVLDGVEPRRIPGRGIGIVCTRAVEAGETILRVPLSAFRTQQTVPKALTRKVTSASVHGLLAASLALDTSTASHPSAPWFSVLPSAASLSTMPLLWTPALQALLPRPAARILSGQLAKLGADFAATESGGLGLARETYLHHWLLVNTRSFYHSISGSGGGGTAAADRLALVPVADLLNHSSSGCREAFSSRGLAIEAERAYAEGDEVSVCYGRHGNDFLLAEYGFVLDSNPWDEVCLDDALMARLDDAARAELKGLGFLGGWRVDARTPGCYRTQVALRVLCGVSARAFLSGGEAEEVQAVVDAYLDKVLAEVKVAAEEAAREVEGLGEGEGPPAGREVLARRWRQIGDLVDGVREQLIRR